MAARADSTAFMPLEYYVYVYWRDDLSVPTPFYVGKGKGSRVRCKGSRNAEFLALINHLNVIGKPARTEISDLMSEDDAFTLEIELICFYGRQCNGAGPLLNRTSGGEGLRHVSVTDEIRSSARAQMMALKTRADVEETRLKALRAANARTETRDKKAAAMRARYSDETVREAQSESSKAAWANGAHRAAHSNGLSLAWKDAVHRKKVIDGIRKSMAAGGAEQRSRTMKSKFDGDDGAARRAKIAEASAARWANPEFRQKMARSQKAAWDSEERREAARLRVIEQHKRGLRNKKE